MEVFCSMGEIYLFIIIAFIYIFVGNLTSQVKKNESCIIKVLLLLFWLPVYIIEFFVMLVMLIFRLIESIMRERNV